MARRVYVLRQRRIWQRLVAFVLLLVAVVLARVLAVARLQVAVFAVFRFTSSLVLVIGAAAGLRRHLDLAKEDGVVLGLVGLRPRPFFLLILF